MKPRKRFLWNDRNTLFDIEIKIICDCMKVIGHYHVWYAINEYVMWHAYGDMHITMYDIRSIKMLCDMSITLCDMSIIHDIWINYVIWVSLCIICDIWACYLMRILVLWILVLCIHMLWFVWDGIFLYTYMLYSFVEGGCKWYLWLRYYIYKRGRTWMISIIRGGDVNDDIQKRKRTRLITFIRGGERECC